jgi:hypothetical protein
VRRLSSHEEKRNKLKWPVILSLVVYDLKIVHYIKGGNNHRFRVLGKIFVPKGREHQSGRDFLPGGAHSLTYSDQTVE